MNEPLAESFNVFHFITGKPMELNAKHEVIFASFDYFEMAAQLIEIDDHTDVTIHLVKNPTLFCVDSKLATLNMEAH